MIPGFVHLWEVLILAGESYEVLLAERQVVELILEDDAGMEEGIFQDLMGCGLLLFREGYLRQIEGRLMRVELFLMI